ncbi:zinc knuckle CX2CX4HX4C containing protein [Tanacetum coccineum]
MDNHSYTSKREGTTGRVNYDELRDREALLHGVTKRLNKLDLDSDTDIMVSDVNAPNIRNHDVVAESFEKCKEVLDTIGDIWDTLMEESVTRAKSSDLVVSKSTKQTSYAGVAGVNAKDKPKVSSNFHPLVTDPVFDGVNISIPCKVVEKTGLEAVLEGGPWLIRKSLIIIKKWSMDTRLLKEELTRIPLRVKLHDVPIQVFEEDDGISLIASFISKPIMLDSYTSSMCNDSWGRSSFARCLIEVNLEDDLVDVVTIGIPLLTRDGFTKETIRVEY